MSKEPSLEMRLMKLTLFIREKVPAEVQEELMRQMRGIMREQYRRLMAAEETVELYKLAWDMGHIPNDETP